MKYSDEESFVSQHSPDIQTPASFSSACLKRKCEYLAGRICARDALARNHSHDFQIISGADRSPTWPKGFSGSITHSHNFAAAAVGFKHIAKGIGIDTEAQIASKRLESIKPRLFLDQELVSRQQPPINPEAYYTLLFSAKESIFKCIYPLTGVFFGFHDAFISHIDWQSQTFQYVLFKSLGPEHPAGKRGEGFWKLDDLIHTAVIEW